MADLTEQQSAQTTKITGADSAGVEDNYLEVDTSGRITVNQGAAGAANWLVNLAAFGGTATALGQTTMASSIPVTLASNQSALAVSQNGTWNITNISGTISLPTGAATAANQTTGNSSLSSIDTKTPALGQTTMSGSTPVVIASNQSAVPITDNAGSLTVDNNGTFAVQAAQSGTWTVQPGNTANSTAWRVEGQKENNSAAPSTTNFGVLPAVANTVAPTYADGNQVALSTDLTGTLRVTTSTVGSEEATYTVIASAIAPGNNKSMLAIYNPTGSGYVLKLREYYIRNAATSAVTGVVGNFELHRFVMGSAPAGGTNLTTSIASHDSDDATPASMRASSGDTISGEVAASLDLIRMSTDDWGPGTTDVESNQQSIANYLPARAKRDGLLRPFIIRAGQGIHVKFATNSTQGSIDVVFVFTKV